MKNKNILAVFHSAYSHLREGVQLEAYHLTQNLHSLVITPEKGNIGPHLQHLKPAALLIDGALLTPETKQFIKKTRLKTVVMAADPALEPDWFAVSVSSPETGRTAAQYYLHKAFRNFAFIGVKGSATSQQRQAGFEQTLQENGHPCSVLQIPDYDSLLYDPDAEVLLRRWIRKQPLPLAILCASDDVAFGAIIAIKNCGLAIPHQVSLLGIDNRPCCEFSTPTLSSIPMPFRQVGNEAVRMLQEVLAHPRKKPCQLILPPDPVIERASTNILHIKHPNLLKAVTFIQEHLREPITAQSIAQYAGMSQQHLNRLMLDVFGHTLVTEIQTQRLLLAAGLLRDTRLSIAEIGERAGFESTPWFCRIFKRHFGTSPGKHRRYK